MSEKISRSLWKEVALPSFAPIDRDVDVDVAVVGAGLTGITTAYLLKEAGCRVALLDRRRVGGIDSSCTTAHLTAVADADLSSVVSSLGRDRARAVWDAGRAAIDEIDTLTGQRDIDCDFSWVPGFRHAPFDATGGALDRHLTNLQREARLATELGFDVELVERTPLVDRPGWRIEDQALFHPLKYLAGLVRHIPGGGSVVAEHSEVELTHDPELLLCGTHRVRAPHVVVATHNPLQGRQSAIAAALLQTELALYTTYAVAARAPEPFDTALAAYWDTSDPYRYVRVDRCADGVRIIAGGEDHKTGQQDDTRVPFEQLERWLRSLVPGAEVTHRWSGQIIETPDRLPIIGEVERHQYVATGFGGNGMTFGTLSAMMLRDAIVGGAENPWSDLFAVNRAAPARGPLNYLRENTDYPYYLLRGRLAGASTKTLEAVRNGEGRLVDVDGQIVAAYRNDEGRLTVLSPVCTHLGCRVAWNQAEATWDCPCHGSRFTATGDVLAGPAERRLEPAAGQSAARRPAEPAQTRK